MTISQLLQKSPELSSPEHFKMMYSNFFKYKKEKPQLYKSIINSWIILLTSIFSLNLHNEDSLQVPPWILRPSFFEGKLKHKDMLPVDFGIVIVCFF